MRNWEEGWTTHSLQPCKPAALQAMLLRLQHCSHRRTHQPMQSPPLSPVQEMLSRPGPKYSTMAPVPPLTVRMPATCQEVIEVAARCQHGSSELCNLSPRLSTMDRRKVLDATLSVMHAHAPPGPEVPQPPRMQPHRTLQITSLGEAHADSLPVSFTPMTLGAWCTAAGGRVARGV